MSFSTRIALGALSVLLIATLCFAQKSSDSSSSSGSVTPEQQRILDNAEKLLRDYFAWDDSYKVKVGPLEESSSADFYTVPIQITYKDEPSSGDVYVSKDGKTLVRGEIMNMMAKPFAENRAKLHAQGSPTIGPADASVTMFEFYDFECPHCRESDSEVKTLADQYKIRVVYKNFPLTTIHSWAETAAIGAECAFMQSNAAFMKVHDAIFENQDLIVEDNVSEKLMEFAMKAGLDMAAFKKCLSGPDAKQVVESDEQEGRSLNVDSTPTFFVNGREVEGGDIATLQRLIQYEQGGPSNASQPGAVKN